MPSQHRINISITDQETFECLQLLAKQNNVSTSELLRKSAFVILKPYIDAMKGERAKLRTIERMVSNNPLTTAQFGLVVEAVSNGMITAGFLV
jgi:hypothetical protein